FAGGAFNVSGSVPHRGLAKMAASGNGAIDANWVADAGIYLGVYSLALDNSGDLYVGGSFFTLLGQPRPFLGSVSTTGSGALNAWDPKINGGVQALAFDGAGALCVGGYFTKIAGQRRAGYACISEAPGPPTLALDRKSVV